MAVNILYFLPFCDIFVFYPCFDVGKIFQVARSLTNLAQGEPPMSSKTKSPNHLTFPTSASGLPIVSLTISEVCEMLAVSRTTLMSLRKRGLLKPSVALKHPRYAFTDVVNFIGGTH